MIYAMEEAAKAKVPFYVLDRPNPITGIHVEGPMLDPDKLSFTGAYPLPLRHGMTIGELAKLVNGERRLNADLHVIEMTGWHREDWFDRTGLPWVNPSPNIRSLDEAILYPGIAMLEASTNYSVGRGTDAPFEQVGADWIDGAALVKRLEGRSIPGVGFSPIAFTPTSSHFSGKTISGVHFTVTDRDVFSSSRLGLELAEALTTLYPKKVEIDSNKNLIGNSGVMRAIATGADAGPAADRGIQQFLLVRQKYLLYR
jgi:uncharacterized protein YbbC (DUF1343 family)